MKLKRAALWTFAITILILSRLQIDIVPASPTTKIYVEPQTQQVSPGETFTVDIKIDDASSLYTYEFRLGWYGPLLNVTSVTEGDFLKGPGDVRKTSFYAKLYNEPDPPGESDYIYVTNTLEAEPKGVDGYGTLATITFLAEDAGESCLDLYRILLIDTFGRKRDFTVEDGYLNITPPKFLVDPSILVDPTLRAGSTFTVNVNLSNVKDLYGLEFSLKFEKDLLNATGISVVPFLNEPIVIDKEINNTMGFVWVKIESRAAQPVSGGGTIANVTFKVLDEGETLLDLYHTSLNDTLARLPHSPPFTHNPPAEDGYFSNIPLGHDIAVSRVIVLPSMVTAGEMVTINVTLKNLGEFTETFDLTLYYDGNIIEKRTDIILEAASKTVLTFNWDTTDVESGTYVIRVEASTVEGEEKITNNEDTSNVVTVEAVSTPIILYAAGGIAVAAVAAGILLYFVKVRKPK